MNMMYTCLCGVIVSILIMFVPAVLKKNQAEQWLGFGFICFAASVCATIVFAFFGSEIGQMVIKAVAS